MDAKVNLFNNFPRPKNLPGGQYPNHWIIGVCHVDVQDTYDLVLAINPLSQDVKKTPRQAEILSLPTIHDKAEEIIPILLDAFACPLDGFDSPMEPFAPWTWSTLDPDMAQALEDALQKHGVKPELCQVGVCTAEERAFLEAIRDGCVTRLARLVGRKRSIVAWGDSTKCHGCDMSSDCFFQPLKRCTGCEKAYYHSKKCQKKHWKQHKAGCRAARDYSDSPELKSYSFLNQEALADPEARALWTSLSIPATERPLCTVIAIHRLIFTGQDTPKNMRLLFGPAWEDNVAEYHHESRLEWLIDPAPGSRAQVSHADMDMVDNPALVRYLRPATEAENREVEQVRQMQALIRQRVGVGRSPSEEDKEAILEMMFGGDSAETELLYNQALRTMDAGFHTG